MGSPCRNPGCPSESRYASRIGPKTAIRPQPNRRRRLTARLPKPNQALPEGPFSWSSLPRVRAERWIVGPSFALFVGSHDGYSRLPSPVRHRRLIFHLKSHFWLVRDLALGEGSHELDQVWRLASPDARRSRHSFRLSNGDRSLAVVLCPESRADPAILQELWSPAYGASELRPTLHLRKHQALPAEITTLLVPAAPADAGQIERVAEGSGLQAYRYRSDAQEHYFAFPGESGPWSMLSWSTDAEFLYWTVDASGTIRQVIAVKCRHLEGKCQVLISRRQPLDWIECHWDREETNILTSGGTVAGSSGSEMAADSGARVAPRKVRS